MFQVLWFRILQFLKYAVAGLVLSTFSYCLQCVPVQTSLEYIKSFYLVVNHFCLTVFLYGHYVTMFIFCCIHTTKEYL